MCRTDYNLEQIEIYLTGNKVLTPVNNAMF